MKRVVIAALLVLLSVFANAETAEEWIALGARVHGGFGAFIPLGIKIGLDAAQRLNAKPRELTVLYYDSDKSPCACFADGIAIATYASVGQRIDHRTGESAARNRSRRRHPSTPRWRRSKIHNPHVSAGET